MYGQTKPFIVHMLTKFTKFNQLVNQKLATAYFWNDYCLV